MLPRRAWVSVDYNGKDITEAVTKTIIDFTYTDRASDQADDLELNVHDRDRNWQGDWYPKAKSTDDQGNAVPGTIFRAKIHTENWNDDGDKGELDCGSFEIDSCDLSGPPAKMSIKALSTPISSTIRREEKNKAWEDTTLTEIASDIAGEGGLQLVYEVEEEINLDRVEQLQKSDLSFLQELCHEYGVSVKVTDDKLVLFEEKVYEGKDPVDTFDQSEVGSRVLNFHFKQDTSDCVSSVLSSYKDPKSGKLVEFEYDIPNAPETEQSAIVNARPGDLRGDNFREGIPTANEDPGGTFDTGFKVYTDDRADDYDDIRADATPAMERQAKAVAREKNKHEWTATLELAGNVLMVAGVTFEVTGFGVYDGKYIVDEATHKLGSGYKTTVNGHRVLEGY